MRGRKYESIKPILKILQNLKVFIKINVSLSLYLFKFFYYLKENFQYQIHHVLIIKPDTFWQKQKTSFCSSKYNFKVVI
jgi:hypothetical protein